MVVLLRKTLEYIMECLEGVAGGGFEPPTSGWTVPCIPEGQPGPRQQRIQSLYWFKNFIYRSRC
ncbi:MAG: hypothetical protein QXL41_02045, partial [Desulfurococcaceae archaeon]